MFIVVVIVSSLSTIFVVIHSYHFLLFPKGVYSALLIVVFKHFSKDYEDGPKKDKIKELLVDVCDVLQKLCRGNKMVGINMIVVLL